MGFLAKLFGAKDPVFGGPPEATATPDTAPPAPGYDQAAAPAAGPAGSEGVREALAAALAQRGVTVTDARLDQLVRETTTARNGMEIAQDVEAAMGLSGPRLRFTVALPEGLGLAQIAEMEKAAMRAIVVDPEVVSAVGAGDLERAKAAAAALAISVTRRWAAEHPATDTAPPPAVPAALARVAVRQAVIDIGLDRIGKPLEDAPRPEGPQVVVRMVTGTGVETVRARVPAIMAAVREDPEVQRLAAAGDLEGAQRRAQQVVDAMPVEEVAPTPEVGVTVRRRTVIQLPVPLGLPQGRQAAVPPTG